LIQVTARIPGIASPVCREDHAGSDTMTEFDWQFHTGAMGPATGMGEWLDAAGIDDHVPRWGSPDADAPVPQGH